MSGYPWHWARSGAGTAWLLGLVGVAAAQAPLPCTLTAQGTAELQMQGSTTPLPLSLADCRDAAVVRGTVVACTTSADGSPSCRAFGAGEAIDAHGLGVGASVGGLEGLQRLLRAVPGQPTGVPRGAETLLPSKVVLLLDQVVLVDFAEADMQGVEAVEFHRDSVDGPLTARIDRAPGPTSIPADAFVAGPYYWAVPVPGERPNQAPRRFTVAPERERQDAIDRLRVFDRQQAGPLATTMMRAAWLAQQNYDYDALATMKAVGLRTR